MLPIKSSINKNSEGNRLGLGSIVEYQQHGKSLIGIILSSSKDKWQVLNENAGEIYLPSLRLSLLGEPSANLNSYDSKISFLKTLSKQAEEIKQNIKLEELWELIIEQKNIVSESDLLEISFPSCSIVERLALRRVLLEDVIFFKRDKSGLSFEPRRSEVVEELKQKALVEEEKKRERKILIEAILKRTENPSFELPESISYLEKLAVFGSKAPCAKETLLLLDEISEELPSLNLKGKQEEKAFQLLVAIGHFSPDQNLTLYRLGRLPRFTKELEDEAALLAQNLDLEIEKDPLVDYCDLLVFSIDSETTKDVDDALSLELWEGGYCLGIHITDVASLITPNTKLYEECLTRASSIYCPDSQIPMLPSCLSEDALSLLANKKRRALSFFIYLDQENKIVRREIVRTKIKITYRLNYQEVEDFLYDETGQAKLYSPELETRILKLYDLTSWLETARIESGAMQFIRREMLPVIHADGTITLEPNTDDTPARKLVSELMIVANEAAARFARDNLLPFIFRSQEEPEIEPSSQALNVPEGPARDFLQRAGLKRSIVSTEPLGHFGLGLGVYTQITSPLRRVSDLINQIQIISFIKFGKSHYSVDKLNLLIAQIEESLTETHEIQRERNRYWLLKYLIQEKFSKIEGIVMKTDSARPLVEISQIFLLWPYEPMTHKRIGPYQVTTLPGERVTLKIDKIDPASLTLRLVEISGDSA